MDQCIILFMDLDGTLWDHDDISVLNPPFKRVSELEFTDSLGEKVRLNTVAIEILRYALSHGFITSTLSWNMPEKTLEALKVMEVDKLFHYNAIEYHPDKASMALKILRSLREKSRCLGGASIIYIAGKYTSTTRGKRWVIYCTLRPGPPVEASMSV
ncbi:magnesium-dependent phosphatase-1 [Desulfurococcus amylolyticus]|uniref:magnesium-dependent phosphatase-1 n=1 Tax=Desulfurococcus amylolyticus TaxID=94694 RepID=UPI0006840C99|nr:magnesium-dependent phosphatase-1 [Desulfurococcus amylolyticus]